MNVSLFLTIQKYDADAILCQHALINDDVEILFTLAESVENSDNDEEQFQIEVSPEMIEWCQAIIKNEVGDLEIFKALIENYEAKLN